MADLAARLEADPEYQAMRRAQAVRMAAEGSALTAAEAPLVAELNATGFAIQSVWDFVNTADRYTSALPILLDHLHRDYPEKILEGIARAMAVPESKFAWRSLLRLFRAQFDTRPYGLKAGLAVALSAIADDDVMPDVIKLFEEPRHGECRILFVRTLKRSRLANARAALESGRQDPQLVKEIAAVLDGPKRSRAKTRRNARISSGS